MRHSNDLARENECGCDACEAPSAEVVRLVTALRDTYADLTQMVPGLTKPYIEKILDGYKGLQDTTVVGRMAYRRLYGDPTTFGGNVKAAE